MIFGILTIGGAIVLGVVLVLMFVHLMLVGKYIQGSGRTLMEMMVLALSGVMIYMGIMNIVNGIGLFEGWVLSIISLLFGGILYIWSIGAFKSRKDGETIKSKQVM